MPGRQPIRRALVSVYDKAGLADVAAEMVEAGVEIIASGGTAGFLADAGLPVTPVSHITGSIELLGGRVKTLHPHIHAGLLADPDDPGHAADLEARGIGLIDLVVCNLYPFGKALADGRPAHELIETIDIGGPAMVRAAAKNNRRVAVVTSAEQYPGLVEAIVAGGTTLDERRTLAAAAFALTAAYDASIAGWLAPADGLPERVGLSLDRHQELRYGENPHQQAALYRTGEGWPFGASQVQGKPLSFNNFADADSAWDLANRIAAPGCVIVKHLNPCGVAERATAADAFGAARDCDPQSAFGGVVALNAGIDRDTAGHLTSMFLEVVVAPSASAEALEILATKPNLRVLVADPPIGNPLEVRAIDGGFLVQVSDDRAVGEWTVVSSRQPTAEQLADLELAWKVGAHCRSNSIVIVKGRAAVGIGAGDQSRVGAARRGVAQSGGIPGAVAASEALVPFRDGLDVLAAAGVEAVVETGGSKNDAEVIAAADEHQMVLLFSGRRHFRH